VSRAGVDPGRLHEVISLQSDDLRVWTLNALVVYVRLAAGRSGVSVANICARLADRHDVELTVSN
jgi:hypothetical protein